MSNEVGKNEKLVHSLEKFLLNIDDNNVADKSTLQVICDLLRKHYSLTNESLNTESNSAVFSKNAKSIIDQTKSLQYLDNVEGIESDGQFLTSKEGMPSY